VVESDETMVMENDKTHVVDVEYSQRSEHVGISQYNIINVNHNKP
jgi:hypothetical protein